MSDDPYVESIRNDENLRTNPLGDIADTLDRIHLAVESTSDKFDRATSDIQNRLENISINTNETAANTNGLTEPRLEEVQKSLQDILFWCRKSCELQEKELHNIKNNLSIIKFLVFIALLFAIYYARTIFHT